MALSNARVWEALKIYQPGGIGGADCFRRTLMAEQKWSVSYAAQTIEEYKKYLYLATVSQSPLSPSYIVDQVWHLHLEDTDDYGGLCRDVLHQDVFHCPGKGAPDEAVRFTADYQATLKLYEAEFSCAPPKAFWPRPKANRSSQDWLLMAGGAGTSAVLLSGCAVFGVHVDDGIWFPIALVVGFIALLGWRIVRMVRGDNHTSGSCSHASYLDGGADGHAHGRGSDDGDGSDGDGGGAHH